MAKPDEPMDPDRTATPSRFPATRWTLVGRAGGLDAETGPIAIAEIVRLYVPALRAHLMHRMQCDEHRADDLLQGFLTDKVLEQRLIGYADPKRGRFRTFLLTALERYVIDTQRRAAAQKRSPQASVKDIDDHIEDLKHPEADREQSSEFDLAWAKEVVDEVLATMRQQCEQTSRLDLWEVFDVRYLKPAMDGSEPEPHESIADRLKLESAHQSGNLLISAKRMFTRVFMNVVSRYTADEAEMRDEVNDLWRVFAQART